MTSGDPHVLGPGLAPTPFTAAEIRASSPAGKLITSQVEGDDPTVRVTNRYVSCDDDGAEIERTEYAADGAVVEQDVGRSTWLDLQRHAAFPADRTTVDEVVLDGPLGSRDCLLYTVDAGPVVRRFWFARSLPGMPVRVVTSEDGVATSTRAVVSIELSESHDRAAP